MTEKVEWFEPKSEGSFGIVECPIPESVPRSSWNWEGTAQAIKCLASGLPDREANAWSWVWRFLSELDYNAGLVKGTLKLGLEDGKPTLYWLSPLDVARSFAAHWEGNLEPCPFCGNAEKLRVNLSEDSKVDRWGFYVICGGCEVTGPVRFSPDEAADRWNKRGEPQPI